MHIHVVKLEPLNKLVRTWSKWSPWAWHSPGERQEETEIDQEVLKGGAL